MNYMRALKIQETLVTRIKNQVSSGEPSTNVVLIVEHPPVYTTGIRTKGYSEIEENKLKTLGSDFVRTNRGGLITFHGPGQLVAYPILNLKHFVPKKDLRKAALGVKWYIWNLEQTVINVCGRVGLEAERSPHTGVWLGEDKVCAMGVHSSAGITSHGIAINCETDLAWYRHIVPCGIVDKGVTSMSEQLVRRVGIGEVELLLKEEMAKQFGCEIYPIGDELKNYILSET